MSPSGQEIHKQILGEGIPLGQLHDKFLLCPGCCFIQYTSSESSALCSYRSFWLTLWGELPTVGLSLAVLITQATTTLERIQE